MTTTTNPHSLHQRMVREAVALRPCLLCRARTKAELAVWQRRARAKLLELLGRTPRSVALRVRRVETKNFPAYRREKIIFDTERGFSVPAYLLVPKSSRANHSSPAILALHGHGNGKADVVGFTDGGKKERVEWIRSANYEYANQFAEAGYVVLAPDARSFGELDDLKCSAAYTLATHLGETVVGLRVWDAMRALDVLAACPEVNPRRIGAAGLSWGGTHTAYLTMLDPRVRVAVVSGYFSSFQDILFDWPQCPCQYIPGIGQWFEFSNLLIGLTAPRPLLVQNGDSDPLYFTPTVCEEFVKHAPLYRAAGVPERLEMDLFSGQHRFNFGPAQRWFDRWL